MWLSIFRDGHTCERLRRIFALRRFGGPLQAELVEEFMKAFVQEGKFNLHIENLYGRNQHHIAETIFKATARAFASPATQRCRRIFTGYSLLTERRAGVKLAGAVYDRAAIA